MNPRQTKPNPNIMGWLKPVQAVLERAAGGKFDLPAELADAHAHLQQVREAIGGVAWPSEPAAAAAEIAASVTATGQVPADLGARLLQAEEQFDQAEADRQVLRLVEARAAADLRRVFDQQAEEIVEHLRPALEAVLDAARKAVPKLKGAQGTDALVALGDAAALKAWSELGVMHGRYVAIREAYGALFGAVFAGELDVTAPDTAGLIRFRNFHELPKTVTGELGAGVPIRTLTTPETPAAFMVWLVTGDPGGVVPECWLPTPDELAPAIEAARELVRERVVEQQAGVHRRRQTAVAARGRRERDEAEARDRDRESPWLPRARR
jgi:hypothetical protein